MACGCIRKHNADAEGNTILRATLLGKAILATKKADPQIRRPARVVIATFCPFCGTKYD